MKRVAILTIQSDNYGNRLQNYALQQAIGKLGYLCESLKRNPQDKGKLNQLLHRIRNKNRYDKFTQFNHKIFWSKEVVYKDTKMDKIICSENLDSKYDCFVIGSDQIWNVDFYFTSEVDFLPMVSKRKKISYAASFGINNIPEKYREMVTKGLLSIRELSVREKRAVEIIKELSNQKSQYVLDPTFLLTNDEWDKVIKRPKALKCEKYILAYYLGSNENDEVLKKIANETQCRIIDIHNTDLVCGPSEFVYLIKHAEFVCTDSFHASVFSILYQVPFLVFERKSKSKDMSSRLDSLLELFNMESRRYNANNFDFKHILQIDFSKTREIISLERENSLNYLDGAIRRSFSNTQS